MALFAAILLPTHALAVPLIRDAEIEHTLRMYGDPIFRTAGLKPSSVHLYIVNDDALNAFVAGGSNMFIHTGLIMSCTTPDMLLGVMAHEAGHIVGGHLAQGTEKLKGAQIGTIMTFVLGAAAAAAARQPDAAAAVITGGQNAVMRDMLAFTRAHEEAADQSALGTLDKLGISASGMIKVFDMLRRHEREHGGSPDPYMRTHPLTSMRIEHVRSHVDKSSIPQGKFPKSYELPHQRIIAKLYGFLKTPEQTMMRYPQSDKSVPARMARAIAYYHMPDLERSLKEMDSLLAEAPKDPFFHELKGQILFENNRVKDALASYQEANRLLANSPLILVELAKVEIALNDPSLNASAITHLEKANSIDNANGAAWRLLATAYGKEGNSGMAALALAEEATIEDDPDRAMIQVQEALRHLKEGTPARQRALDLKARVIDLQREKEEDDDDDLPF